MKRLLLIIAIFALGAALTSCGKNDEPAPATETTTEAEATTEATDDADTGAAETDSDSATGDSM